MKIYEFKAGIPKDDMFMGLLYPISFMLPTLIILLILETVFPNKNLTHIATLNAIILTTMLSVSFIIGGLIINIFKRRLGHYFNVLIDDKKIIVKSDNKILFTDFLENVKINENGQMFSLKLYGKNNDVVFIGRDKRNPFGFCEFNDLLKLKELATDCQKILSKHKNI